MAGGGERPGRSSSRWTARVEWGVAAVAALILVWMIWALIGEAADDATPPDLRIALEPPQIDGTGVAHVDFILRNAGGRAASMVGVGLRLGGAASPPARRLVIDYVPAHSEVSGRFYLAPDEAGLTPLGLVEGYVDP